MHTLARVVASTLVVASTVATGCRPSASDTAIAPAPLSVSSARPLRPVNTATPAYYTEPASRPTARIVDVRTEDFGASPSIVRQPGAVADAAPMPPEVTSPVLPESRVPAQFTSSSAPPAVDLEASRSSNFILPGETSFPTNESQTQLAQTLPPADTPVIEQHMSQPPMAEQPQRIAISRRPVSPSALDAVNQQANQRIEAAFSLARRGAMFAARAELIQSLRMIAQALDTLEGGVEHSRALAEGLQAIEEAEDFHVTTTQLKNDLQLSEVVAGHETPVLKGAPLDQVSSLVALQRYFGFAQQQLTLAAGGTTAGSRALYGLGKVHMSLAGNSHDDRSHELPKAIVYHQSALAADASNYLAANEVGVLLAQFGQLEAAKNVLLHSVQIHPHAEGWQNLAVVHSRLGETELAHLARQEQDLLIARQETRSAAPQQMVEWVSPQAFVARGLPDDETRSIAAARSAANKVPAGASPAIRR